MTEDPTVREVRLLAEADAAELDALEAAEAEVERHERAETLARVLYCHLNGYPIGTSWAGIGMARRGQYRDAARAALDVLELR